MLVYKEDGSWAHLADDVAPRAKRGREFCVSIKWFLAIELKGPAAFFIPGADQAFHPKATEQSMAPSGLPS